MFRVSCIQLCSSDNVEYNLIKTKRLILKAVKQRTNFILTPEVSSKISLNKKKLLKTATSMDKDLYLHEIKGLAKRYKKWILIGSLILKIGKNKLVNRSILISPKGRIKCYYDKIHMYDAKLSKKERAAAVRAKRKHDPNPDRKGKPILVSSTKTKSGKRLIKK